MTEDGESWHLISLNENGRVTGCTRYLQHPSSVSFQQLRVRTAGSSQSREWAAQLEGAVETELAAARRHNLSYIEIGGWAVTGELRGTTEALRSVLTTYAWGRLLGGCLGISTATSRHGCASILHRIGGYSLQHHDKKLAPYYDPIYGSEMEVLGFDSRKLNPRYQAWMDEIAWNLTSVAVFCRDDRRNAIADYSKWIPITSHDIRTQPTLS